MKESKSITIMGEIGGNYISRTIDAISDDEQNLLSVSQSWRDFELYVGRISSDYGLSMDEGLSCVMAAVWLSIVKQLGMAESSTGPIPLGSHIPTEGSVPTDSTSPNSRYLDISNTPTGPDSSGSHFSEPYIPSSLVT